VKLAIGDEEDSDRRRKVSLNQEDAGNVFLQMGEKSTAAGHATLSPNASLQLREQQVGSHLGPSVLMDPAGPIHSTAELV